MVRSSSLSSSQKRSAQVTLFPPLLLFSTSLNFFSNNLFFWLYVLLFRLFTSLLVVVATSSLIIFSLPSTKLLCYPLFLVCWLKGKWPYNYLTSLLLFLLTLFVGLCALVILISLLPNWVANSYTPSFLLLHIGDTGILLGASWRASLNNFTTSTALLSSSNHLCLAHWFCSLISSHFCAASSLSNLVLSIIITLLSSLLFMLIVLVLQ